MASINLQGDTSGSISISAPSVAGSNTLTLPATTQTLATQNALGVRNLIINGDMRIDQRNAGSSVTVTSGGTGNYTLDRWYAMENTDGSSTVQQVTDAPDLFSHSLKYTITSADTSLSATQFGLVRYNFEASHITQLAYGTSSAKTITISFWVKSSVTGTFSVSINNSSYTSGYIAEYTILSANTWEQKFITITGDTSGTWNLSGNGSGLALHFGLGAGVDRQGTPNSWFAGYAFGTSSTTNLFATNGATWQITGVQLEVGDTATPFEHRPYDMELARCQRYYEKSYDIETVPGSATGTGLHMHGGNNTGATTSFLSCGSCNFKVTKRAIPTLTIYDYVGNVGVALRFQLGLAGSPNENWTLDSVSTRTIFSYSATGASRSGAGFHFVANSEL